MNSLTDKYRPRTLADVLGQSAAVAALKAFAAAPHPHAFLFHGPTGTGKTSAALCLANDLGLDVDRGELSGLWQIASGEQSGETVRRAVHGLRIQPWHGSGWKVLLVNECDRMTDQAAFVWLDVLEDIPKKAVVVFTTNNEAKLPQRLRDRCERVAFDGGEAALAAAVRDLVARVWWDELGRRDPPDPAALGDLADGDGNVSFRRVLQWLAPILRAGGKLPPRPEQSGEVVHPRATATDSEVRPRRDRTESVATGRVTTPSKASGSPLLWLLGGVAVGVVAALAAVTCAMCDEPTPQRFDRRRTDDLMY